MKMRIRLALVVVVLAALLSAFVGVAQGTQGDDLTEDFDAWNEAGWSTTYYDSSSAVFNPVFGSTSVSSGVLHLDPSLRRGGSYLLSEESVINTVPATLKMRLRFPEDGWRQSRLNLSKNSRINDDLDDQQSLGRPYIHLNLGTTNHTYLHFSQPTLRFGPTVGTVTEQILPSRVMSSDTWIDLEMHIKPDGIDCTYDGVSISVVADVASSFEGTESLKFSLEAVDDYDHGGIEIDYIYVDQPPLGNTVSGHVYGDAGAPLGDITVRAYDAMRAWDGELDGAIVAETTSAPDGSYLLCELEEDPVVIAFCDSTSTYRDLTWPNRGLPLDWAYAIDPSENPTGVDAYLTTLGDLADSRVQRVSGRDRYATALAISSANFTAADTAVVVNGLKYADALAAAPLAGYYDAPILLTAPDLPLASGLEAELDRLGVSDVIVVGGTASISSGAATELAGGGSRTVTRFWGPDRYATAAAVALEVDRLTGGGLEPFICRGDQFPDALSVSPFAFMEGRPILLTKPDGLPNSAAAAWNWISRDENSYAILIGGRLSISDAVLDDLAATSWDGDLYYVRLAGPDRYRTSQEVVEAYGGPFDVVGVASGEVFPDALAGGAAMGHLEAPVILTQGSTLSSPAKTVLGDNGPYVLLAECFGGERTVAPATFNGIDTALGDEVYDIDLVTNRVAMPAGVEAAGLSSTLAKSLGVSATKLEGTPGQERPSLDPEWTAH